MTPISAEARAVHDSALLIDLHCDLLLTDFFLRWRWTKRHRHNPLPGAPLMGHCDLPRLQEGGWGGLTLGVVVSPLRRRSGPDAIAGDLEKMHRRAAEAPQALAVTSDPDEILGARAGGKIALWAGLEGAHGLDGRLDRLPEFQARGLGMVGLAHFTSNAACRPMVGWGASATAGLSPYGQELVDALNDLGLVVDVAHVNKPGVLEVCARSRAPVLCSHTACTAVHPSPRGLDDAQIRAIAETGGVVGVIFVTPFLGPGGLEAVVAHLEHLRRTVGVAHCAIGTDWEGWAVYPDGLDSAEKMPRLTEALLRRGWSPEEIHAAYGGNVLRVFRAARAAARTRG